MESLEARVSHAIQNLKNPRVYYNRDSEGYTADVQVDGKWIGGFVGEEEVAASFMNPETAFEEAKARLFIKLVDHFKTAFAAAEESKLGLGYAGPVLR